MADNDINRDRALFTAIAQGNVPAFQELFQFYYPILRFNAFKLLKSEYWAEEIAQEVFLHVWDGRETLSVVEHPAAWLYRITSNKCFDRARRQMIELRAQYVIQLAKQETQVSVQKNNYDLELLQRLVREAIDALPEQQRAAYLLQQEDELSYKEIAEKLGISRHTVRNHLIRAFQAVRKYIESHPGLLYLLYCFINFL